jgi:hypothetical protein
MQQKPMKCGKQTESLKQRVGYFEEELGATRNKLDKMQVDACQQETD